MPLESARYHPTIDTASLYQQWPTVQLSTRDFTQDVPIDFQPNLPGISLTTACFSDKKYDMNKRPECISNLLHLGYRRFVVDLFWHDYVGGDAGDEHVSGWSLCPVYDLGDWKKSTLPVVGRLDATGEKPLSGRNQTQKAQELGCALYGGGDLFLFEVLVDWLEMTYYDVNATVAMMILNLREGNLTTDSLANGAKRSSLGLVSPISKSVGLPFNDLYTPVNLVEDRKNLNNTWLGGTRAFDDDEARYFDVTRHSNGRLSSDTAWPSESYLVFNAKKRMLIALGNVEIPGYDVKWDKDHVFLGSEIGWPFRESGSQEETCAFNPSITMPAKNINASWATTIDTWRNPFTSENSTLPRTECGRNIIVNSTLSTNTTIFSDSTSSTSSPLMEHYFALLKGTVWSWDVFHGEPSVISLDPEDSTTNPPKMYRCATLSSLTHRWKVTNCHEKHFSACRVGDSAFQWTVGKHALRYFESTSIGCPKGSTFDAPRTALENRYLLHALHTEKGREIADTKHNEINIWVDVNSVQVPSCWVSGNGFGANSPCPYEESAPQEKIILVPTVAAVIVLILGGLMGFVKLGTRRRELGRRRRRREMKKMNRGLEYEGVPS